MISPYHFISHPYFCNCNQGINFVCMSSCWLLPNSFTEKCQQFWIHIFLSPFPTLLPALMKYNIIAFSTLNQNPISILLQRQGCIHGEDLPYFFGAPLVGGFNHFPKNYTKAEISLSEVVMLYWSNFIRTG